MGGLETQFNALLGESSWLVIPIAFVVGLASSLTPCVYPLIPILVGYIGGRAGGSRWRAFFMSVLYVVGMAITFAVLGLIASLPGHFFGDISQSRWVNIGVGALMVFFALVLMGVVKLPMPAFLQRGGGSARRGLVGAFLMGLSSGMISGTCTVAIVLPLLAYVGGQGNIVLGGLALFSFALGMGALLVAAGTFTGVLRALPKSGEWIRRLEIAFGVLMIVVGVGYFMVYRSLRTSAPPPAVSVAVTGKVAPLKWVGATAPDFTAGDLDGRAVTLSEVLAKKPALVVFWATWCPACVEEVPDVIALSKKFGDRVAVIGVATKDGLEGVKQFARERSVPYTIVNDPTARIAPAYGFNGVPAMVVVGRDGVIAWAGSNETDAAAAALEKLTAVP